MKVIRLIVLILALMFVGVIRELKAWEFIFTFMGMGLWLSTILGLLLMIFDSLGSILIKPIHSNTDNNSDSSQNDNLYQKPDKTSSNGIEIFTRSLACFNRNIDRHDEISPSEKPDNCQSNPDGSIFPSPILPPSHSSILHPFQNPCNTKQGEPVGLLSLSERHCML
jgi:hypothetical protein